MSNKSTVTKILQHPDKEEILSKLLICISPKDISEWLSSKYSNINEKKFLISENAFKSFLDSGALDIYSIIQEDLSKTKSAIANSTQDQLDVTLQNLPAYKDLLINTANQELDIRLIMKKLCTAMEIRIGQVFDHIQSNPNEINTRIDRLVLDYGEVIGNLLDKYYKFTEAPADITVQHNVTLQVVDQHITAFHDVIKKVLSQMDLESSLFFMEVFNEEMSKLKPSEKDSPQPVEMRLAEAKLLNETINKKINE